MKKLSLALLLALAVNSAAQTAPANLSLNLNNKAQTEITPEVKSWVAQHKTLVRSLVAATVVVALGGAATVAYKKNEKFQKFVDSAAINTRDFSKKAWSKTSEATKNGFNASTEYVKNHKAITAIVATVLTAVAGLAIDKAVREDESVYNAIIDAVIDQFIGKTEVKTTPVVTTKIEAPKVTAAPVVTALVAAPVVTTKVTAAPTVATPVVTAPVAAPKVIAAPTVAPKIAPKKTTQAK